MGYKTDIEIAQECEMKPIKTRERIHRGILIRDY